MRRDLLTLPNILSLLRLFLVFPLLAVMLSDLPTARLWGVVIMALGALTDFFDGRLARRLHCESEWGRILDPLADKAGIAAVALALLLLGDLPLWFFLALVSRDIMILLGGLYLKARYGVVLPSIQTGKWAVGIFALTLVLLVAGVRGVLTDILIGISLMFLAASFVLYIRIFFRELRLRGRVDGIS
jgi:CDP-diacylglycerol--glycerol-3-phosphate 3-phosphatidyltransferase